jgi:two-component system OmpR family response regulator
MKLPCDPALGGAGGGKGASAPRWLLAGGDTAALERLALVLSRFAIDAQPYLRAPDQARHRPVLCDARARAVARQWIDEIALRSAPLLFVGAATGGTRARLIDAGAADAMSARVAASELAARMKAADRLHETMQGQVRLAGLTFDTGLRQVRWHDLLLPLMPREFDLLLVLARQAGSSVSRDDLLRAVWRTEFDPGTNSVEVHVCKLRRSLMGLRGRVWIETVRHCGYRLVSLSASEG